MRYVFLNFEGALYILDKWNNQLVAHIKEENELILRGLNSGNDAAEYESIATILYNVNSDSQRELGKRLFDLKVGDKVIERHNAYDYTPEVVEDVYSSTHVIVKGRKFRRADGRQAGVRQGTTEWYYTGLKQYDSLLLAQQQFEKVRREKIVAIHQAHWSKMLSKDVDEIYEFLKEKGVLS